MSDRLPGMPQPDPKSSITRERIRQAVIAVHKACVPMLEVIDSNATIRMSFRIAGDTLTIQLQPGKPNDEGKNP